MATYNLTITAAVQWDVALAAGTFDVSRSTSSMLVFDNGDGTFTLLEGANLTFSASGPTGGTCTSMKRVDLDASNQITVTYESISGFSALAAGVTKGNALQYALYGNDSVVGSAGSDILVGFAGNDTMGVILPP